MSDKPPDAHHSRTSLVQFDGTRPHFLRITKPIPSKVQGAIAVISHKLSLVIEPESIAIDNFSQDEEDGHLHQDVFAVIGGRQCVPGTEASGDVLGHVRKTIPGGSGEVSDDGEHGNASMLEFHCAKAVEFILVGVLEHSQGIPEPQGSLDTKLVTECRGSLGGYGGVDSGFLLGRSEGGSGTGKSEKADNFHHGVCWCWVRGGNLKSEICSGQIMSVQISVGARVGGWILLQLLLEDEDIHICR